MDNKYDFSNRLSTKNNNSIIWFSDSYCDLDSDYETDKINRLVVAKENGRFVFSVINPFLERNGIRRSSAVVAFSPAGNGSYSRNLSTGSSFQDDVVKAFHNTMNRKKLIKLKKE